MIGIVRSIGDDDEMNALRYMMESAVTFYQSLQYYVYIEMYIKEKLI